MVAKKSKRSVLTLEVMPGLDGSELRPQVRVFVDGVGPFDEVAPEHLGFDPQDVLLGESPLHPILGGRRVAVYRCSCGQAGCGVIAPWIEFAADGERVIWSDFRNYTGVFGRPRPDVDPDAYDHRPRWDIDPITFDKSQYVDEIERAAADMSWEIPIRTTARLLDERLSGLGLLVPPGYRFSWVAAQRDDSICISFWDRNSNETTPQRMLRMTSAEADPKAAADDIAERLLATPAAEWLDRFGYFG